METLLQELIWQYDIPTLVQINTGFKSHFLDLLMSVLSAKLPWFFLYIATVAFFVWTKNWRVLKILGLIALAVAVTDFIAYQGIKPFFDRLRPCKEFLFVQILDSCGGRHSFPSNHATNFMVVNFYLMRRSKILFGFFTTAITMAVGLSRVYLGVHYLSDVIAGFFFGLVFALTFEYIYIFFSKFPSIKKLLS